MTTAQIISSILMLASIACNLISIIMCSQPLAGEESSKHRNIRMTLLCFGVSLCILSLLISSVVNVK